nr:hypothetical protein [uncultured bacterium]
MPDLTKPVPFLAIGVVFEAVLALTALLLGWFLGIDALRQIQFTRAAVICGVVATVPIFLAFLLTFFRPIGGLEKIKRLLIELLGPPLCAARWYELIGLALVVGFSEELLFRGVLQPWLSRWGEHFGLLTSNVLFGLAHFITPLYSVIAGLLGLYLGWLLNGPADGNLFAPMLTHALYDYLAFLVLIREVRRQQMSSSDQTRDQPIPKFDQENAFDEEPRNP